MCLSSRVNIPIMREHDSTLWNGKFCPTVISEDTHIVNMERRKTQKGQNDWQSPALTDTTHS